MTYRKELKTAIRATLAAGEVLHKQSRYRQEIKYKGEINLVTKADDLAQAAVIKILKKDFPGLAS